MKHFAHILVLTLATGAWSLTSWVDTTILKQGSTWLYSRNESSGGGSNETNSFKGTMKFTVDSLRIMGDTLKFNVVREDSGEATSSWWGNTTPHTFQTTAYAFYQGSYSPSTPFFAERQSFSDTTYTSTSGSIQSSQSYTSELVTYRNDTLRQVKSSSTSCTYRSDANLEKIGHIQHSDGYHCGITSASNSYQLLSFNGAAFEAVNVVVALRGAPVNKQSGTVSMRGFISGRHRVLFGTGTEGYDIRGQRARLPDSKNASKP